MNQDPKRLAVLPLTLNAMPRPKLRLMPQPSRSSKSRRVVWLPVASFRSSVRKNRESVEGRAARCSRHQYLTFVSIANSTIAILSVLLFFLPGKIRG